MPKPKAHSIIKLNTAAFGRYKLPDGTLTVKPHFLYYNIILHYNTNEIILLDITYETLINYNF
ncbi:hypothetical protein TSYNTROOL_12030 [Tepidanaerobacter syntrophicus]|nr:hypothetical protein TSYNTROOL_12030 [Tepidanaerobacter syntrophicus]